MKPCAICGSPIQTHLGEYVCKACGTDYVNEDGFDEEKNIIAPPPWGQVKVDLSGSGEDWEKIFNRLKEEWTSLESASHLSIFKGQFERVDPPRKVFSLYAPAPAFAVLKRSLEAFGVKKDAVEFSPLLRDELYRVRDRFYEDKAEG